MCITKKCTKCGEVKAIDAFYADKRRTDGKRSACKTCSAQGNRAYYTDHKDAVKECARKHYTKNRSEKMHYIKDYRAKNPHVKLRSDNKRRAMKRNLPHQPLTPQQYDILHRQKYEIFGGNASGN